MKEILKRGFISFAISAFSGTLVNLVIDIIFFKKGFEGFASMSPEFRALFPTDAMAAYVNILLYGAIGAVFALMTFVYDIPRMGFVFQSLIYFIVTGAACMAVTILLWQLQKYPPALIGTMCGYFATHMIIFVAEYRALKKDIKELNEIVKVA
ncbi:MAG: DUF3021 family protein [Eubacterium sp.]|nr:DUF3021 family protein [Eubacterium sp.]